MVQVNTGGVFWTRGVCYMDRKVKKASQVAVQKSAVGTGEAYLGQGVLGYGAYNR